MFGDPSCGLFFPSIASEKAAIKAVDHCCRCSAAIVNRAANVRSIRVKSSVHRPKPRFRNETSPHSQTAKTRGTGYLVSYPARTCGLMAHPLPYCPAQKFAAARTGRSGQRQRTSVNGARHDLRADRRGSDGVIDVRCVRCGPTSGAPRLGCRPIRAAIACRGLLPMTVVFG